MLCLFIPNPNEDQLHAYSENPLTPTSLLSRHKAQVHLIHILFPTIEIFCKSHDPAFILWKTLRAQIADISQYTST